MFQCSMLERIVKMKNQDLAKLPHSQGKGCWTNKNKTFCENENSLAYKSHTSSEKPQDRQVENQRGDPLEYFIN